MFIKRNRENGWLPWWWYLILIVMIVSGIIIFSSSSSNEISNSKFLKYVISNSYDKVIGILLISIPIAHFIIFVCLKGIRNLLEIGDDEDVKEINLWSPTIIGVLEIVMYVGALFMDKEGFIGIWLVFKVASQWVRWGYQNINNTEDDVIQMINSSRRRYMHFLIGNALVLICSTLIYKIIMVSLQ